MSGVNPGFRGDAVLSSDQPLVSTVVQFSNDAGFKLRLLSNGFQSSDSSNQYLVATVLKHRFSRTTVFSVQNTESVPISATIKFYDADNAGNLASTITHVIPAQSSKYIEMDNAAHTGSLPDPFNGSAIITAVKTSDSSAANVVSAASELYTNSNLAANFEGVPLSRAANTINLATALCQKFGLDTFYAVQNSSPVNSATISVQYKNTAGANYATDGPYPIGPGQKKSITTCSASGGSMVGFTGSAVITSSGAPIVVIGKAQCSLAAGSCVALSGTQNVFTAFLGEPAGTSKRAFPFVRWANDPNYNAAGNVGGKQRAFLAIQSLTAGTNQFDVKYYDKSGNLLGTQTLSIAQGAKGSSNPEAR